MRPVAFLIRCLSNLISLMDRLNPMRHMHAELLRRSPIIWRSYVLHVLWYLAIAYIGLYALGSAITVELDSIYSVAELDALRVAIWSAVALGAAYWIIKLKRVPLPDLRLSRILRTFGLYFVCLYPMVGLPTAFMIPLNNTIASTISDEKFYADRKFILSSNRSTLFGSVSNKDRCGEKLHKDMYVSFNDVAKSYGYLVYEVNRISGDYFSLYDGAYYFRGNTYLSDETTYCIDSEENFYLLARTRLSTKPASLTPTSLTEVYSYFSVLKFAKDYSDIGGVTGAISNFFTLGTLSVSLALSVFLVFLTYSRNCLAPKSGAKISHWPRRFNLPKWPTPLSVRNWDRRLLKLRPRAWATRFHVAVFYASLIILPVVFAADVMEFLLDILPYNMIGGVDKDIVQIGFVGFLFVGFVVFLIYSLRNQRRHIRCLDTTNDHLIAISAFFAPTIPGLAFLLIYGFLVDEEKIYGTAMVVSFFLFTSASISYILLISTIRSLVSSIIYAVISVIVFFSAMIILNISNKYVENIILILLMCYFMTIFIILLKNKRIKNGTIILKSNILIDISKYILLVSVFTPLFILVILDKFGLDLKVSGEAFILALTFGYLPVFLFLCRPVYDLLRHAYHIPSEE